MNLSYQALETSIKAAHQPALSHIAASTIDKLFRTIDFYGPPPSNLAIDVKSLLTGPMDVVDKVTITKGVTYIFSQQAEGVFPITWTLMGDFVARDVTAVDNVWTLNALKIILAVGESLDTNVGDQVEPRDWESGYGMELRNWIRNAVLTFSTRFRDDFMIIEVLPILFELILRRSPIS